MLELLVNLKKTRTMACNNYINGVTTFVRDFIVNHFPYDVNPTVTTYYSVDDIDTDILARCDMIQELTTITQYLNSTFRKNEIECFIEWEITSNNSLLFRAYVDSKHKIDFKLVNRYSIK